MLRLELPTPIIVDTPGQKPKVIEGQIRAIEKGWVLDGLPYVMQRVRSLLKNAKGQPTPGKYGHCPLLLPATPDAAKDLLWIRGRYVLECDTELARKLETYADRYDRALIASALGDSDTSFDISPEAYQMAEPPRPHQAGFRNLYAAVRRMLLADDLGLGKTISAILTLCEPESRPAVIVVPTHLTRQWQAQIKRFLPAASTHIIKGRKVYDLPKVDILITAYSRLQGWQDVLVSRGLKSAIFDEVQDLRKIDTEKRRVARALAEAAEYCLGLSATPIYNYGAEIWSVLDVIYPGALGPLDAFSREWCTWEQVKDPVALNSYLKARGLMLRRTRADLGIVADPVNREVITLEGDLASLKAIRDVAKLLAMSVLSNRVGESSDASRELDWRLRQATGVAKARAVAEFVKTLVESGESVLLVGWHREVYDIWLKDLAGCSPVMCTGSESPLEKDRSVKAFTAGESKVFICSLRSGAGIDGLQHACSTVVFGELDWSPQVMDQVIGRVDREGQQKPVNAYFLTIDDGADPSMIGVLADKQSQHDGVVEGKSSSDVLLEGTDRSERIRAMAEAYLASIGEAAPVQEPETGLHAEVVAALRKIVLPTNSEREMQEAVFAHLAGLIPDAEVQREVRIGERSRLDFLIIRGEERIAIECKIDQTGRPAVYRQVRKYAEEAGITGAVLLAPWSGVSSFTVEEVPVIIVDYSKARLAGRRA